MEKRKPAGPEVTARKRILKQKQAEYPDRRMAWIGGVLYFTDTNPPTRVTGVEERPKSGSEAKGLTAAFPPSSRRRDSRPRKPSILYRDLPQATAIDDQCCECGKYPNQTKRVETADYGSQEVTECSRCHTLMRPYVARRRTSSW